MIEADLKALAQSTAALVIKEIEEKIFQTLHKQDFFDWYTEGGKFDSFIRGDENPPTKEEIRKDINRLFNL